MIPARFELQLRQEISEISFLVLVLSQRVQIKQGIPFFQVS